MSSRKTFNKIRIKNSFGDNFDAQNYMELAEIREDGKMTFFAKSWKNLCRDEDHYVSLAPSIITHETLHVVINNICKEDKVEMKEEHWPHLNGMDDEYANDYD